MWQRTKRGIFSFVSVAILFLSAAGASWGQPGVVTHAGVLPGGATFLIEVPAKWNGTLFCRSRGTRYFPAETIPLAYIEFDPGRYARLTHPRGSVNSASCLATDTCTLTCVETNSDGFFDLAGNCE
jgi:hypothetical protein